MVTTGRFRPVQGSVLALFFFTAVYSLVADGIEGATTTQVFNPGALMLWHIVIALGSGAAMSGEIIQTSQPPVADSAKSIDRFVLGLIIEFIGEILFSLCLFAYVGGIIASGLAVARSLIYLLLALGFVGRMAQILSDIRRIRNGVTVAHDAATRKADSP